MHWQHLNKTKKIWKQKNIRFLCNGKGGGKKIKREWRKPLNSFPFLTFESIFITTLSFSMFFFFFLHIHFAYALSHLKSCVQRNDYFIWQKQKIGWEAFSLNGVRNAGRRISWLQWLWKLLKFLFLTFCCYCFFFRAQCRYIIPSFFIPFGSRYKCKAWEFAISSWYQDRR